jgi:hypothetical protein
MNKCPECDGEIEWPYSESDYGEPEACPLCHAMIRAERFDVEDRDGVMQYHYEWRRL